MRAHGWWISGVIGGVTLWVVTLHKVLFELPRFLKGKVPWSELVLFPFQIFLMGFVCGVVVWSLRILPKRLGTLGDAITGVLVMNIFFLLCMLVFDRSLLLQNHSGAMQMFGLATIIGLVGGVWVGHDLRSEQQSSNSGPTHGSSASQGTVFPEGR